MTPPQAALMELPPPPGDHDHDRCVDTALQAATDLCAARGVRLTRLRRRVLELVWQGHRAVKAYDLLRELEPGEGAAKPPTVYRALDFLIGQGLVHRLESLNAYVGCPAPGRRHEGQFLICSQCGEVREMAVPAIDRAIADRAADAGFEVVQRTVEVHGTCRTCRDVAVGTA
jgi:Fur family transcriptional regulator, zinc uptake regulator